MRIVLTDGEHARSADAASWEGLAMLDRLARQRETAPVLYGPDGQPVQSAPFERVGDTIHIRKPWRLR